MAVALYAPPVDKPILSAKQIGTLTAARVAGYARRNSLYALFATYYEGRQNQNKPQDRVVAMNGYGKPIMRVGAQAGSMEITYSSNRLTPIVDDAASTMGRVPTVRVEIPDPSGQADNKSELLTKYLLSTYDLSRMKLQQAQGGFWQSCLGDYMYVERVDFNRKGGPRTLVETVDPRYCYPSFKSGSQRFEVYDVVIAQLRSPEELRRDFPFLDIGDDVGPMPVYEYLSPYQRTVVLDTGSKDFPFQQLAHIDWDLEACPAQWVWNKPNGNMAQSDIGQSLSSQDFLDFAANVWGDALIHMVYPIVGLRNVESMEEGDFEVGPGATVNLGPEGQIEVHQSAVNPAALEAVMQQTLTDLYAQTGTSQVRQEGQMKSSIVTGRAINAIQGPESTRIDLKRQIVEVALQGANASVLELQERAPLVGKKPFEIYGRFQGKSFREQMSGADIDGWRMSTVAWDELTGLNEEQRVALAAQGRAQRLWGLDKAMQLAGIENPRDERKKIEQDVMWEAGLQASAGAAMQNPQVSITQSGGDPATGQIQTKAPAPIMRPASLMQAGFGQPPAGPSAPSGVLPTSGAPGGGPPGALPTGVPQGVSRRAVQLALQKVADQLKGSVFAAGDLATSGQAAKVSLLISDKRDYAAVKSAVSAFDQKPTIHVQSEAAMPQTAVRLV